MKASLVYQLSIFVYRHNEDGSYTYGYEAADGSFKLETRYPDGLVQGKYGYIDENGEVKVRSYSFSTALKSPHNSPYTMLL